MFATGTADRKFCIFEKNRHCARNAAHPTSENGKLALLTSGRRAFQQRAKRAWVVIPPQPRTFRKYCAQSEKTATSPSCKQITQPSGAATPRDSDTHKRIAVPRLPAFFGSTPDQAPKAAKLAVLIPGPGMLVNVRNAPRVVIPPPSETPRVSPCEPLCAIFLREPSVCPLLLVKANVGRLCEKSKNALKSGLEQRCNSNFLAIFVEVILWFFDRLRKAPALLAPEPSLSLTSQVQRKF